MKRETVGKIARDLMLKEQCSQDPIELQREMHKDYEKNVHECVDSHKKTLKGDFFVVVITKMEPLMKNVLRNYFTARSSCPTPNYDETVYHYHRNDDSIEFLWTVPSRDASFHLKENALQVVDSEKDLLNFVLDFSDGTLYRRAKKLNGETDKSGILLTS